MKVYKGKGNYSDSLYCVDTDSKGNKNKCYIKLGGRFEVMELVDKKQITIGNTAGYRYKGVNYILAIEYRRRRNLWHIKT